ncbi:hypothetical protein OsI_29656 [Oryza sativa Indica Group]|uniref:Uncharacterized protein n=2 Tax=Oryza sativa TaxID=4530 RepID=Q6YTS4_ORYSJ|nr:hypothetical protein OsI_29656 [Oryza sativa Indica Group]EAZ43128.1 hypothetical protein OsJ_27717 [Oryza sativa Japonica Group]BAD10717.1 hypothetical protein [Oryza sativa Japonica Group]
MQVRGSRSICKTQDGQVATRKTIVLVPSSTTTLLAIVESMHTQGSKSKGRTEDGRRDASSLCPGLSGRGMEHGKEGEDRTRIHPGCAGDKLGRTVAACQPWQGRGREGLPEIKRLGWYGRRPVAARSWGPSDVTALTSEL